MAKNGGFSFVSIRKPKTSQRRRFGGKDQDFGRAIPTDPNANREGYRRIRVGGKEGGFKWVKDTRKPRPPSPTDTLAQITNENDRLFEEEFVPVIEDVIAEATDEQGPNREAEKARERALKAHQRQKEIFERSLKRTGTRANQQQRSKLEQQFGLSRAKSSVNAANIARREKSDTNLQVLQGQIEAGQSLRGNALQGLGAAAGLETQRNMLGQQLARQDEASFFNNVGTGAGIGFAVGGPVGAAVGGVAGGILSIFD